MIHLDNMLVRITQQDVVYRRYLQPGAPVLHSGLRRVHQSGEENGKTEYCAL